jgi:acetyl esterase/lipase
MLAATGALSASGLAAFDDPKFRVDTYTYKRVGPLEINADVHRANDDVRRPVAVWIHGGALINGNRAWIDGRARQMLLDAGYALVSIDYRLAPETKLPAIIEDVGDAFAWIRNEGSNLFHGDVSRIAVLGGSAGGYLTLMSGFRVHPRPAVLVSFWGYGDIVGDWYSKPSPHPRHHSTNLTEVEARVQVSGPAIADSSHRNGDGGAFYNFCRQRGIWPKEVSGWDPRAEPDKFVPYMPVRNVTKEFPPTLLIHGKKDTDVPYEQSVLMAEQFKMHGVAHELVTVPDAEHGLPGADPELVSDAYRKVLEFVSRYIPPDTDQNDQ